MRRLKRAIKQYLSNTGLDRLPVLGGDDAQRFPDERDSQYLRELLEDARASSKTFIWIAAVMYCVLFVIGIVVLIRFMNETSLLDAVFGVAFLTLAGLAWKLRQLGMEKFAIDFLAAVVVSLPPESVAKVTIVLDRFLNGKRQENRKM